MTVIIGKLSCITAQSIRGCFDILSQGTLAQDATLIIEEQSGQGNCLDCGFSFEVTSFITPCPKCLSHNIECRGGKNFMLKSITIES